MASLCLTVNANNLPTLTNPIKITPSLPGSTITQPTLPGSTLPGSTLPPIIKDPVLTTLNFTAPTELKLVKAEKNLVSIQWKDNSTTETKYVVERKKSDGSYIQLAVLGKDTISYNDTSIEPGITYYYRVKAGKDILDPVTLKTETSYTEYSNELIVNTPTPSSIIIKEPVGDLLLPGGITKPPIGINPGDIIIPGETIDPGTTDPGTDAPAGVNAPEALAAEAINESRIDLSWEDKSDNESGFLLYRTSTGDWEEPVVLDANTTSFTDENLQSNTTYYYVLFAYKDSNASPQSNVAEVMTPADASAPAATETLAAPEALAAQAQGPNEVVLSWQDKSENEQGFLLYKTAAGEWEQAATLSANVTAYTDKAVQPNTKYYYIVYAYVGETPSKESNMVEITTPNQAAAAVDFTGASSWALEELKKAVEYGLYTDRIMNNYTQNITREEFCELVIKLYEKLKGTTAVLASPNPFRDTANDSILKAYAAGIVNGTSKDTFSPNNPITRQDICVMLYRAITSSISNVDASISGVSAFADENLIGNWAIKEVKFSYKNNIMRGSDNKIMPRDNTNREQALLLVKRVYEIFATFDKLMQ